MEKVTVKKEELLSTLKSNREDHQELFSEAMVGYREEVIAELSSALEQAKNYGEMITTFKLSMPVDQTKDYDRAIRMMEMSVDDEITLSEGEFTQYVLDEWHWKREFLLNSLQYTKMK